MPEPKCEIAELLRQSASRTVGSVVCIRKEDLLSIAEVIDTMYLSLHELTDKMQELAEIAEETELQRV